MYSKYRLSLILACLVMVLLSATTAAASPFAQSVPAGFELILSDTGTRLYRKDYSQGNPDFVQVVSLAEGAAIIFQHGDITSPGTGAGAYGGNDPSLTRQTLAQTWDEAAAANPEVFCATNGQFFSTNIDPTRLAFPLKKDGVIVSDGYGLGEYPDQKLLLQLWSDRADIVPLTEEALEGSSAPNMLAGLREDADKGPQNYTGRTFVGIDDANQDNIYETVLIFNSKTARQPDAAQILRDFGADRLLMLDGGGSTQLVCRSGAYIESSRTIPQAILVVSKSAEPLSAEVTDKPNLPVLVVGEPLAVRVEIRNSGGETWRAGSVRLVNLRNPWGAAAELPLAGDVAPDGTAVFTWTTESFAKMGVYTTAWTLSKDEQSLGEEVSFSVVVLPEELADKKRELEEKIRQWTEEQLENIEQLILQWIEEQVKKAMDQVCGLPFLAVPVFGVILARRRRGARGM